MPDKALACSTLSKHLPPAHVARAHPPCPAATPACVQTLVSYLPRLLPGLLGLLSDTNPEIRQGATKLLQARWRAGCCCTVGSHSSAWGPRAQLPGLSCP